MKTRALLALPAAALALVACGSMMQTLAPGPLPQYDTTVVSGRPAGAACINEGGHTAVAIELIDLGEDLVYLAGGEDPISEAEWDDTRVRLPHLKNSKRHLLFDDNCLYRSPGVPTDCQGDACVRWVELYDHTWFVMNAIAGQGCHPSADGCEGETVEPGHVSITTIDKCQEITFAGPTIHELVDPRGNRYVMHATADGQPKVDGVPLPAGWTLATKAIDAPLVLAPRGEGRCYYNIVRDALTQSYHQYVFADAAFPPAGFTE